MKHLFKISELSQDVPDEAWTLQEIINIIKNFSNGVDYQDIFLWTKSIIDDNGVAMTELHFGVSDE